ncbi:hypothetical protein M3Y97_00364900 [Aphelenchoides bicaudatus]|nr:hypothetical protein M3Y97_00364900 [Aphelenchoides bicaudatus]
MRKTGALVVVLLASVVALGSAVSYSQALFPLNTVVFFPSADPKHAARLKPPGKHGKSAQNLPEDAYLATIESVRPIIDIAMIDSQKRYLQGWAPQNWLQILEMPIRECDDQQTAGMFKSL